MNKKDIQIRELKLAEVTLRENENGSKTIEGLIPYNSRSEDMGFFEYITPSAFNKTLADGADVRALFDHESSKLLGRVKNGSLRLRSDEVGLHIECDLPDTSYAVDAYNLIKNDYNRGMSFGFIPIKEEWEVQEIDGEERNVCYLLEVRLLEVSFCVSFPAYEATTSNARSLLVALNNVKADELSEEERKLINEKLRELQPEPTPSTGADPVTSAEEEKRQDEQLQAFIDSLNKK